MTRSSIICMMGLILAACASVPEASTVTTVAAAEQVSEELECMCDCLNRSDSSGDSCVERCF
jgi:hypothetical protein